MRRSEGGAAVVTALVLITLLGLVAVACLGAGAVVAAHRRTSTAADLAALAAAGARERGRDPCAAAGDLATRNGARLDRCSVEPEAVSVEVSARPAGLPGSVRVRARARAGP